MKISAKVKKRLKSKMVWVGVLVQVILVVGLQSPHIATEVKLIGGALIEAATLLGFLNNPDTTEF